MPKFIYTDSDFPFAVDVNTSAVENRAVSNRHDVVNGSKITVFLPAGTGGFEIWANIGKDYTRFVQEGYATHLNPDYLSLSSFNEAVASFSGLWFNITNHPTVLKASNAFYVDGTYRFVRLQGDSVSGGTTLGYLWTDGAEYGM